MYRSETLDLALHGFADYFFQTLAADYWVDRGYDFFALDLRKCGRSIRPHQTPNFVTVLAWAHARGPTLAGMVLNSPWLDLRGSLLLRTVGTSVIDRLGARRPYLRVPRTVSGLYAQSLHRDYRGEWDFNLAWKPLESWPVYAGWLRAVRRGHVQVHRGIDVHAPVLVLTSGRSAYPEVWDDRVGGHDIVLDVDQIREWAHQLGDHVTLVRIPGALHDITLSAQPVRTVAFDVTSRWLAAHVER